MSDYDYILLKSDGRDVFRLKVIKEYQYTILTVINNVKAIVPKSFLMRMPTPEHIHEQLNNMIKETNNETD